MYDMIQGCDICDHFHRVQIMNKETVMEEKELSSNELSQVAGGEESEQNGARCPNCGSTNTTMDLALLEHFCMDCGYRWE